MNPSTQRTSSKLNLIRLLAANPEGLSLEEIQKVTGHKTISLLKKELGELYMIEMYPYSPSDCVDLDFDGDKVKIRLPITLNKTFPLAPKEWAILRRLVQKKKEREQNPIADSILKKIDTVIPTGDWSPYTNIRSTIIKAIDTKQILELKYWKRNTNDSEIRNVAPWILWEENDSYLLGFDTDKNAFRSFRLDCILDAKISDKSFSAIPENASEWLNGFKQLFGKPNPSAKTATLLVSESSEYHLSTKLPLVATGKTKSINNTVYKEYSTHIPETTWFVQTILGYGKSVLVASPPEIKNLVSFQIQSRMQTP
ncbi:WYL domain-containing protein [Leptospira sp. 96542]|nr:WYL domain-containing protein [Leptospira sp. 96542]